jgi:Ca-activated chloride channel family protein
MTSVRQRVSFALLAVVTTGWAQQTGIIQGKVTDPAGGAIAQALVEIVDQQRNVLFSTRTDNAGHYSLLAVPLGTYDIRVSSPGFASSVHPVSVAAGRTVTIDVRLNVGMLTATITVHAQAMPLSTQSTSVSMQQRVRIPANGIRRRSAKWNTESYDHYEENPFQSVRRAPLSTFGADVDTASYSNVRRMLLSGEAPPPGSIRVEELINYFRYDYAPPDTRPFSVTTELASCPWNPMNQLLLIGIRTPEIAGEKLPPANLVFLIDVSGSMKDPEKLPLVKRSLQLLIEQLRPDDRVAMVVYAGAAGMVLPPTPGDQKRAIADAIDRLEAGGSTHGAAGIQLAYRLAEDSFVPKGNNRVILATDGDFNVGVSSDDELVRLIEKKRDTGVFLTVLGYGMGNHKDSKLEKLARHGNGNHAYIDDVREARKVLVNEMSATLLTVAKDVKLQIEFNPAKVKQYRLIGYENRILRPEEFNDDKKDAGDIGAGHQVTVLYELIRGQMPELAPDLRYQVTSTKPVARGSSEIAYVKIRYKDPDASTSKLLEQPIRDSVTDFSLASTNIRFASAVAQFGMLLRSSPYKGSASYEGVIRSAQQALGLDPHGYRKEFVDLVKSARTLGKEARLR